MSACLPIEKITIGTDPTSLKGDMMSASNTPEARARAAYRADHWQMLARLAFNAVAGTVIGAVFAVALILWNIGGIGDRIAQASSPLLPILLIVAPFAFIFGGAVAASSIALLPYRKKKDLQ